MKNYHVYFTDGSAREIQADEYVVKNVSGVDRYFFLKDNTIISLLSGVRKIKIYNE